MPVNTAPSRRRLHARQISCSGYERDDGLWDVEAHMCDVKSDDFLDRDGRVKLKAGEALHDLHVCITVDDTLTILAAQARTVSGPFRECPAINAAYAGLIGMQIKPGFIERVKTRFKGVHGCTHLTELIGPLATTAYQTLWPVLEKANQAKDRGQVLAPGQKPPPIIDSCHSLRRGGEAVQIRWPQFYQAEHKADGGE